MKKITLMDIMESLNSDDVDGATAALHEWFVDQGKQVQAGITGVPVAEAEQGTFTVQVECAWESSNYRNAEDDEEDLNGGYQTDWETVYKDFQASSWQEAKAMAEAEIAEWDSSDAQQSMYELIDAGWQEGRSGSSDDEPGMWVLNIQHNNQIVYKQGDMDESRVDELSRDTMMSYAKAARKDRDHPTADDEKVGRRVAGLGMVAGKARREKAAPQYESDIEEAVPPMFDPAQNPDAAKAHGQVAGSDTTKAIGMIKQIIPYIDSEMVWILERAISELDNGQEVTSDWLTDLGNAAENEAFHNGLEGGDQEIQDMIDELVDAYNVSESTFESEEVEEDQIEESEEDLIAELNEAFKGLETVSDKLQNVEGAQVGEQGKVPVNTKATLPSHKGKDRVGGDPVEVKGKGHTGHALEKAPKVVDVKVKNTVQNGKEEPKKVADKGDASALLNKKDGKENTTSPISGKGAKGLKK